MPAPLDPAKREAILEDIRAGQKSARQIGRDHEVATSTVSRLAKATSTGDGWQRSQTKNATKAKQVDNAALRAVTSRRFLEECNRFLDDLHKPHVAWNFGGKDNTFNSKKFPEPPTGDKRNLIVSAATALDKHLAVEKHDGDNNVPAARSMLGSLAAGLQLAYDQLPPPADDDQS